MQQQQTQILSEDDIIGGEKQFELCPFKITLYKNTPKEMKDSILQYLHQHLEQNPTIINSRQNELTQIFSLNERTNQSTQNLWIKQIFPCITQWRLIYIRIRKINCNGQNILQSLCHIKFHALQQLNLLDCNIGNIEPIAWIDGVSLKKIYLLQNKITNLKPFHKTIFLNIQEISFEDNHIFSIYNFQFFAKISPQNNNYSSNQNQKCNKNAVKLKFSQLNWKKYFFNKNNNKMNYDQNFCNITFTAGNINEIYLQSKLKSQGYVNPPTL